MLLTRWLKHHAFMNQEFRRYGWYAFGEIVLIVVGIVIALQIDTWHEEREVRQRIDAYLEGIARDVADDLERVERLARTRERTALQARLVLFSIGDADRQDEWYGPELVARAGPVLQASQAQVYFVANSSTYRALESSGLLNELADTRVKTLLFDYYRTVERIANTERDLNNVLRDLSMEFQTAVGGALGMYVLGEPMILWNEDSEDIANIDERRRIYGDLLAGVTTQALLSAPAPQGLLQEYEHLLSLGRALDGVLEGDEPAAAAPEIFAADSGRGFPVLVENGVPALHSLGLFSAPNCPESFDCFGTGGESVRLEDDALVFDYAGGQPWVFIYLEVGPIDIHFDNYQKDYSDYDRIRVELRPNGACPAVDLVVKDVADPDDGTETRVRIEPTPDWATYTYDLDQFDTADRSRLNVFGFLFGEDPCELAVRDMRFLRPGEP